MILTVQVILFLMIGLKYNNLMEIKMIRDKIRPYIWYIKDKFEDRKERNEGNISYINWWSAPQNELQWFTIFIKYHFGENLSKHINFYSVMGPVHFLNEKTSNIKIFYTGENVTPHKKYKTLTENAYRAQKFIRRRYLDYSDYALNKVDLSLGFANINNNKYIRFPLWIMYIFKPTSEYIDIKNKIEEINNIQLYNLKNSAVVINGHDYFGTRTKICDDIADIIPINYAGKWRNNTHELWDRYNNNKLAYISKFKFNICPENMDAEEYVTEKIFEAISTGTIPIYHGSFNNPEPDIIVKDRAIFWNFEDDNIDNIKLLKRLKNDDDFYYKFAKQPKLTKYTADYVYERLSLLKEKINNLI